jgi:hypothetical protein
LFDAAVATLRNDGLLLLNATSISGFDLQVLWDQSTNIYPPDRINLISSEGLTCAAERHGFQVIEFSTPGMFDVDSVKHGLSNKTGNGETRFLRYLAAHRDADTLHDLQEFLQRHRLSSFVRLALRKV